MINSKIIESLRIIFQRLINHNINWVIVGSASLSLQDVDIQASDIDILTDRNGAFRISELLKDFIIDQVRFKESEFFNSYLGKFDINGIKVEIMGELKGKINDNWVSFSHRLLDQKIVEKFGMKLPVSSLKDQLNSYSKSNRERDKIKVIKIKKFLNKSNINNES